MRERARERERGCLGEIHLSGPSCVRSLLLLRARVLVCECVCARAVVAAQKRQGDDAVWQFQLRTMMMKMMAMMSLVLSGGGGSHGER